MHASEQIDQLIARTDDWRGAMLAEVRATILASAPDIVEEWKWRGSPCWSCHGLIAVGNAHKDKVKLTFSHGAALPDPTGLFNNGLGGKVWRALDLHEGMKLDKVALQAMVRAAIAFNVEKAGKKKR